jgi:hypothetical protein
MSDQPGEDAPVETTDNLDEEPTPDESPAGDDSPAATPTSTGHPAVDEVLRSLDDLDGRAVDQHVAAFEEAHDRLRRALSSAGDDQD